MNKSGRKHHSFKMRNSDAIEVRNDYLYVYDEKDRRYYPLEPVNDSDWDGPETAYGLEERYYNINAFPEYMNPIPEDQQYKSFVLLETSKKRLLVEDEQFWYLTPDIVNLSDGTPVVVISSNKVAKKPIKGWMLVTSDGKVVSRFAKGYALLPISYWDRPLFLLSKAGKINGTSNETFDPDNRIDESLDDGTCA